VGLSFDLWLVLVYIIPAKKIVLSDKQIVLVLFCHGSHLFSSILVNISFSCFVGPLLAQ
jgi:hypothetical protein